MSLFCCSARRKDQAPKTMKPELLAEKDVESKREKLVNSAKISNIPAASLNIERPVKGIDNLGNSCYISSALECLGNVHELVEYCLTGQWEKEANTVNPIGTEGKMLVQFVKLIHKLWEKSSDKSINIKKFKECLDDQCTTVT